MIPQELQKLMNDNEWDASISFIKKQSEPLTDELLESLAWCLSCAKKYEEAKKAYSELVIRKPTQAKYHSAMGYQFYATNEYKAALEHFERALELHPTYFKTKYRAAYSFLQLAGEFMQFTKNEFWKAIKHFEDCHSIYGDYDEETAKRERSTYAKVCFAHGKALIPSTRHIEKSISMLIKATELKPDERDYKYNLAQAFFSKGSYKEALELLNQMAIAGRPEYYEHELKAQILSTTNEFEKAIQVLLSLTKWRKKDYLFQRLAENYLALGNLEKADEFALQAINLGRVNYKNYFVRGKVLRAKKQYKTAISLFEQAREKRQSKYKQDCPEAIREIDAIMEETNGIPNNLENNYAVESQTDMVVDGNRGTIAKYNEGKGFGFIKVPSRERDLFFHVSQYEKGQVPQIGISVSFEIEITAKGESAVRITIVQ